MESLGIISEVDKLTPWCAGMVVVHKKNGAIRICVEPTFKSVCVSRGVYPLPKVDKTLAQLASAKIFSKLDANSGFWQIPLTESSKLLMTFITPFGRYYFHKLPFGICSAPEHFQKRMSQILKESSVRWTTCWSLAVISGARYSTGSGTGQNPEWGSNLK
eukprot:Em0007g743a